MEKRGRLTDLVVVIIIALCTLAVMSFALGDGASTGDSWFIQPEYDEGSNKYSGESVIIELDGTAEKIYIKIGNVYNTDDKGSIVFSMVGSSSAAQIEKYKVSTWFSQPVTITLKPKTDRGFEPGWYLVGNESISYKYIRLTTEQSFEFDEIVFFDKDGKKLTAKCHGGFENRTFVSAENVKGGFAAVIDGQSGFAFNSKTLLSDKEESIALAAKNLYTLSGNYVSGYATPLGVLVSGFGVVLFGNTALGARFMPLLFSFATFVLVYFFAKRLFTERFYAILASAVWLLCGTGLALGGTGIAVSAGLFFALASYFCIYIFYTADTPFYTFGRYKYLLLSGALIAIGGSIEPFALTVLPGMVVFAIIASVKGIRPLKKRYITESGLEKEYAREKYYKAVSYSVIDLFVSLIVFPFIGLLTFYGIFIAIYSDYYSVSGVFAVMFRNIGEIAALNNGSYTIGWLIGLGSEKMNGLAPRVISANKALVVFSTILTVLYIVVYSLNCGKKVKNERLALAVEQSRECLFVAVAFVMTYLASFIGGIKTDYSCFAYSLVFLTLAIPYSYKLYNKNVNRMVFGISLTLLTVVIVAFFGLSAVCFLGIDIPESVAAYLYNWTL